MSVSKTCGLAHGIMSVTKHMDIEYDVNSFVIKKSNTHNTFIPPHAHVIRKFG
jgi:hypothetical protein